MDSNKSVFDKLNSLEQQSAAALAQNEEIINLSNDIKSKPTTQSSVQPTVPVKTQVSEQEILRKFVKESKKEHFWFGPSKDFYRSKNILNIVCIALIIVAIISTILTSTAFKMYSTFTLFENIWTIFVCIILSYSCYAKKRMQDTDLKDHSCDLFQQDADGTWRDTNQEKKRFKWFRRLSYIAVIANIIVIWANSTGGIAIAATLFELAFLGLSIAVFFMRVNLYCMYGNIIFFTGKNISNGTTVTIVFDVIGKKLIPLDEYKAKYGMLFE